MTHTNAALELSETMDYKVLGGGKRIAFIQACWHREIVDQCRESFVSRITEAGVLDSQIAFFEVPGSFEIPLLAKQLAETDDYAVIVASGLVTDGGIYRHEFVADAVISGMMRVQLDSGVPIVSAVLTPHHFHEHAEHRDFFFQHFKVKGVEAANACTKIMLNLEQVTG